MSSSTQSMLEEQEAELERIRKKRNGGLDKSKFRLILNILFLIIAAAGLVVYFVCEPGERTLGLYIIGAAMLVKIIEFVLRFTD